MARVVIRVDEEHGQSLVGFACRMGLTADQADDAVQEVLLRLFRTLMRGVTVDDPKGWSFRTMYRIAMDEHRLRRRLGGLRERLGWAEGQRARPDDASRISLWSDVDACRRASGRCSTSATRRISRSTRSPSTMGITAGGARAVANKALISLRSRIPMEDRQ